MTEEGNNMTAKLTTGKSAQGVPTRTSSITYGFVTKRISLDINGKFVQSKEGNNRVILEPTKGCSCCQASGDSSRQSR